MAIRTLILTYLFQSGERFMVDFKTYRQLHRDDSHLKHTFSGMNDSMCDRMKPEQMALAEPPPAPDIYVFPNEIPGYDLKKKKWGKYRFYHKLQSDDSR